MTSSVNWYFQAIDEQLKASDVYSYIQEIGYGNENISGDFSTYWLDSSLKISPVEQVELNGWFVGFVETADNIYFFAANIEADDGAAGSNAAEITMSILSDMNIYCTYHKASIFEPDKNARGYQYRQSRNDG